MKWLDEGLPYHVAAVFSVPTYWIKMTIRAIGRANWTVQSQLDGVCKV